MEGDTGAPLEEQEISLLENLIEDIKPFMDKKGTTEIEKHGVFVVDETANLVTPLVNDKECAFVTFKNGIAFCAIEKAYEAGIFPFRKPLSCHLYPVRINKLKNVEAVNYHEWEICQPACDCGINMKVPVYKFLKEALIRKYGNEWYNELEAVARNLEFQEHVGCNEVDC